MTDKLDGGAVNAPLIDILREEHRNIGRLLRALEHQVRIFAGNESPDYDVIVGVADYLLDFPDRCHHPKEDAIAAKLATLYPGEVRSVRDLASRHLALHLRARRFRDNVDALLNDTDIARSEVVGAALMFIDAQWAHMRDEETDFFPLAERLLKPHDWRQIEAKLERRHDPVFGDRVEAMFKTLSERLLAWEAEDEGTTPAQSGA
jgi:hemerythrin-like domain-containing protein